MPITGLQFIVVLRLLIWRFAASIQLHGKPTQFSRVNQFEEFNQTDLDRMYCQFFRANQSTQGMSQECKDGQICPVLIDAQLAVERLQASRLALRQTFEALEEGKKRALSLKNKQKLQLKSHEAAKKELDEQEADLMAFSEAIISLQKRIDAEETLIAQAQKDLCERRAMLQTQKTMIDERSKEIEAKQKAHDTAWEHFEEDLLGSQSSRGELDDQIKAHNASKHDLIKKQAAIAASSEKLEERKKRLEEGQSTIASARGQMNALKGAVEREEKTVEKEEKTLKLLNTALSQQSESNKAYQYALRKAQTELHLAYYSVVDKQGRVIEKHIGVDMGIAETMGLQDGAIQSVQRAIDETKRAMAYCNDDVIKEFFSDEVAKIEQLGKDSYTPPHEKIGQLGKHMESQPQQPSPSPQNSNQVLADRLKNKIDELLRSLPKF
eukprot:gnl/MRDRNA2_/MRDRNA2_100710_c0_seq1.p1 gnl/MRDRNA2_/MRDRNA2_100710_c0~~gnl/MRDRNA2_/MRDRNA2_100710_c0_seq1.p1  ORF type:complete len:438 (-),score=112.90 gnl/MRDRNA2_/MRDRNA2_100710_c0_seq1:49-1362(-)